MEYNTYNTVHVVASEGYYLTEADASIPELQRTYTTDIYVSADDPAAAPGYWREVPAAEAEAAMAALEAEQIRNTNMIDTNINTGSDV